MPVILNHKNRLALTKEETLNSQSNEFGAKGDVNKVLWSVLDALRGNAYRTHGVFDDDYSTVIPTAYLAFLMARDGNGTDVKGLLESTALPDGAQAMVTDTADESIVSVAKVLASRYAAEELRDIALASFDAMAMTGGRSCAECVTPKSVASLALNILDPSEGESLVDLGCGWGEFLAQAAASRSGVELFGMEISPAAYVCACIHLDLTGVEYEVENGDMLAMGTERRYDKIFAQLPFGMRAGRLGRESSEGLRKMAEELGRPQSADWLFAGRLCGSLRSGGRAVAIMANGATFNHADRRARQAFVEDGRIEAVVALPGNIFYSTGIPSTLIVFGDGRESIRMVDASDLSVPGRRWDAIGPDEVAAIIDRLGEDGPMSRLAPVGEIAQRDYVLAPHRYLMREVAIENPHSLGSLAIAIERGAGLRAADLDKIETREDTGISYLPVSEVGVGRVGTDLPHIEKLDPKYAKACIQTGDLVLTKIGSAFRAAVVEVPEGQTVVATGNLYVVRLDTERVDPYFVAAFLASDDGRELVLRRMTGTTIPTLSLKDLREVEIPLPPMEAQRAVAERYQAALDELEVMQLKVERARATVVGTYDEVMGR